MAILKTQFNLSFCKQCFLVQIPKDSAHLKSWHSAQKTCSYYDASLVPVENEVEQGTILCVTPLSKYYKYVFLTNIPYFILLLGPPLISIYI